MKDYFESIERRWNRQSNTTLCTYVHLTAKKPQRKSKENTHRHIYIYMDI